MLGGKSVMRGGAKGAGLTQRRGLASSVAAGAQRRSHLAERKDARQVASRHLAADERSVAVQRRVIASASKRSDKLVVAAAAADGAPAEEKKFLGIPVTSWGKFAALGFMFFSILFNYTILRDTKDVLVVTAPGSGAEVIPFLKTWVNLPMAFGFMWLYAKLSNVMSPQALFYTIIFPFLAFFTSFAFILYPLKDVIHPYAFVDNLVGILGPKSAAPLAIVKNWSFCLFYVMAELWGSVVVSVLFWGFANQICTVDEAKQFYPLFGLGANVALIFSGRAVKYFSAIRAKLPPGVDGWGISLRGMMGLVLMFGLFIALDYFLVNKFLLPNAKLPAAPKQKKKKEKLSVPESLKFLAGQRYIRDMAALVVAYGISINLVEVTWKSKIKAQFPNPNDYSSFMGDFSTYTGAVTFVMMIVSRFIFRKFGWGTAALITPIMLFVTGILFFGLVLFSDPLTPAMAAMGLTPLLGAVYVGAAQNIFSKSSKYSLFDPCKEMAYIPLDQETKVKGKAAIDVVCNPLGKSGGALIQQFMILTFGSLAASTPYLAVVLFAIVGLWIRSSLSLNGQFVKKEKEMLLAAAAESDVAEGETVKVKSKVGEDGFVEGEVIKVTKDVAMSSVEE